MTSTTLHPLLSAAHRGDVAALDSYSDEVVRETKDAEGRAAIHYCCAAGHAGFLRALLARGVSPNSTDDHGRSAAHYAAAKQIDVQ